MSRLTIIIPLDSDTSIEAFEETLASVLVCKPDESDVLVATSAAYNDPWGTAGDGVVFLNCPESTTLPALLNRAFQAAEGEIVHILHPGTEAVAGWTDAALQQFDMPEVGIVIPCLRDRQKPKRVFSLGICYHSSGVLRTLRRSRLSELPRLTVIPHIAAVFFRRSALLSVNLFDDTFLPQLAYAEVALAMKSLGWKTRIDTENRMTVRPNRLPATHHLTWGLQLERLYFRRLGRDAPFWTLGRHFASFFSDGYRHFPKLSAFRLLTGRVLGLFFFGEVLRASARQATTEQAVANPVIALLGEPKHEDAMKKTA